MHLKNKNLYKHLLNVSKPYKNGISYTKQQQCLVTEHTIIKA